MQMIYKNRSFWRYKKIEALNFVAENVAKP